MENISELKQKGIKGGLWNFTTTIISQIRNFIVSLILARLLDPHDFGLLGMAMAFAGIVDAFVDFGFGNAIIQKNEVTEKQISTVFYINLSMGMIFMLLMCLTSGLVADFFHEPQLEMIIIVMSVSFIIRAIEVIPKALFRKNIDFKTPFKVQLISGIISGIIGIVLAFASFGVWALVLSQVVGWLISTSLTWYYSKWKPLLYFKLREVADLWKYGYKFSLSVFIDMAFSRLDTIIIGRLFSAATLGLFYRAHSLNKLIVQYSFNSFSGVLFPSLSKLQDDLEIMRHNVLRLVQVVCFLTFLFSGLMYVCSEEVIKILYGNKWDGAIPFFNILAVFSFIYTLPTIFVTPLLSIGKSGLNLKIEIIKKTAFVIAIPIGISLGGLYGYVYSTQIAGALTMILNIWALKYIGMPFMQPIKSIVHYIIPFGLCVAINYSISLFLGFDNLFVSLIFKAIIYVIVYFGYHYVMKSDGMNAAFNLLKAIKQKR